MTAPLNLNFNSNLRHDRCCKNGYQTCGGKYCCKPGSTCCTSGCCDPGWGCCGTSHCHPPGAHCCDEYTCVSFHIFAYIPFPPPWPSDVPSSQNISAAPNLPLQIRRLSEWLQVHTEWLRTGRGMHFPTSQLNPREYTPDFSP